MYAYIKGEIIDISDDIVETDQSGALSLSASVEAASAQATGQAQ